MKVTSEIQIIYKEDRSYLFIFIVQYIPMKRSEVFFGILRIPLDILGVLAALLLSFRLREANVDLIPGVQLLEPAQTLPAMQEYLQSFVWPGIIAFLLIAAVLNLYALRTTRGGWSEIGRIIVASLLWLVVVMGWYFLVRKQLFYSRVLLIHSTAFLIIFVSLARAAVTLLQRAFLRSGFGVRLVVSIGNQHVPKMAQYTLEHDMRYEYLGHIPTFDALKKLEHSHHLDLVLQTDPNPEAESTIELIDYCRSHHIGYGFLPPVLADVPHLLRVELLGLLPMMRLQPTPLDGWGRVMKRLFDFVMSIVMIGVLSPVFIVIVALILLEDGWPFLYVSKRVGEQGRRTIRVLKFRSMVKDADAKKQTLTSMNARKDGPLFKIKNDPRITKVGRILRRFDLDELPQLFNVLTGSMSLVGPRPHLPEEVEKYTLQQRRVFAIKPGMTGYAQISGRSDLSFADEMKLDLKYIEEWSPALDLWILWRTVFVVIAADPEKE